MRSFRTLLALLLLVIPTAAAFAQTDVGFGFLAGANQSRIAGDTPLLFDGPEFDVFETIDGRLDDGRLGMLMGLFVQSRPRSGPGFRIELDYAELGGQGAFDGTIRLDNFGETDITGDVSLKTTYLEVPVLAIVPLGLGGGRWSLVTGLSAAFSLRSEMRFNSEIQGGYYTDAVEFTDQVHSRDYHAIVGVEFLAVIKETEFLLGLRWKRGLLDFENGIGSDPARSYRHEAFAATLGVVF